MTTDREIRDKLAKLERLFARGATPGERAAAGAARDRLQARLDVGAADDADPEIELQYSLPDVWSVRIFVALCRKHGVRPIAIPGNGARRSCSAPGKPSSNARWPRSSAPSTAN